MELVTTTIDLDAIAHNVTTIKSLVGPSTALMCVVKADAYNHGAARVAPVMEEAGADSFGVATLREALELRRAGIRKPILAWIWSPEQDFSAALAEDIDLGVISPVHAEALIDSGLPATVAVMVETGMHRSAVEKQDWERVLTALRDAPNITITGLFSHLACADEPNNPATDAQAEQFREALALAHRLGIDTPRNHLCNTPGTLTRPDLHFTQVRVGLGLYGLEPIPGLNHGLRPAMTWSGTVTVVKHMKAGESASYGFTWTAPTDGYTCVVPVGYADGLFRAAQGHLEVTINGRRYPQVGRVCMDQIIVWLGSDSPDVHPGDTAIIFGADGMSATELAEGIGTINYELICAPCGRTVRRYQGGTSLAVSHQITADVQHTCPADSTTNLQEEGKSHAS